MEHSLAQAEAARTAALEEQSAEATQLKMQVTKMAEVTTFFLLHSRTERIHRILAWAHEPARLIDCHIFLHRARAPITDLSPIPFRESIATGGPSLATWTPARKAIDTL